MREVIYCVSAACIVSLIVPPTYFRVSPLSLFKDDYHKPGRNSFIFLLIRQACFQYFIWQITDTLNLRQLSH